MPNRNLDEVEVNEGSSVRRSNTKTKGRARDETLLMKQKYKGVKRGSYSHKLYMLKQKEAIERQGFVPSTSF